jgi:hypothetical protein
MSIFWSSFFGAALGAFIFFVFFSIVIALGPRGGGGQRP